MPFGIIYMDPDSPSITEERFVKYDWTKFYRYAEEQIPPNMPEARGHNMTTHCFVDSDHAGDKATRRSQMGTLIFCNCAPANNRKVSSAPHMERSWLR